MGCVYHQFLSSGERGGGELYALDLARELAQRGEDIRLWVPEPGPIVESIEEHEACAGRYAFTYMTDRFMRQLMTCAKLAPQLWWQSPGLAHFHSLQTYRWTRPALLGSRLRMVVHIQIEPGVKLIEWSLRELPDLVITCADFMVEQIREVLGERARDLRIVAVPNAVDMERYVPGERAAARDAIGVPRDVPLILMMANLAPHKGQRTLLRAVGELKRRGRELLCLFAGEERGTQGGYGEELEQLAAALEIGDRVRFLGFRSDAPVLLRAADMFVLPTSLEGLPFSILEAQATGAAVVLAAPTPGVREVVSDGETGYLIAHDDHVGYADRLEQLIDHPELAAQIVARSRAHVEAVYSWERHFTTVDGFYRELLEVSAQRR